MRVDVFDCLLTVSRAAATRRSSRCPPPCASKRLKTSSDQARPGATCDSRPLHSRASCPSTSRWRPRSAAAGRSAARACCRTTAGVGSTVTPPEMTRSSAPGIVSPPGRRSVNRAREKDTSASTVSHGRSAPVVGPLDADAAAGRPASVVPASPTNSNSESRPRYHSATRRLQAADAHRAHAELRASARGRAASRDRRLAATRIDADDGAARVVAVEAHAGVRVELGAGPRPERRRRTSGSPAHPSPSPEFSGLFDVTSNVIHVGAHAERRAKTPRPLDLALRVHAGHRLTDVVLARRRQPLPGRGVIEADRMRASRAAAARRSRSRCAARRSDPAGGR